jgi:hypothetical protein
MHKGKVDVLKWLGNIYKYLLTSCFGGRKLDEYKQ